jgi:hypothetical protein
MSTQVTSRRTVHGHLHAEAFCLMAYACSCGHRETIWNSRDGVTAFSLGCPSCCSGYLRHVNFAGDRYAPDHKPYVGQRVWVSLTKERSLLLARRNIAAYAKAGPKTDVAIEVLAADYYEDGQAPDLQVTGYTEVE